MSAFLYLSPSNDQIGRRRVDFANVGSLFAESEELITPTASRGPLRWKIVLLVAALLMGDMVLIARPQLLADIAAVPPALTSRI